MRYHTTLVLAILVLIAAGIVYVYRDVIFGEAPEEEPPAEALELVAGDPAVEDAVAVAIEKGTKEGFQPRVAFKRGDDGDWFLAEPVQWPADDYEVRRIARALLDARYEQAVDPERAGSASAADLGLEPPQYRVRVEVKPEGGEARTVAVDVGRRSALTEGVYVRPEGETRIPLLKDDTLLERCEAPIEGYRKRGLVDLDRTELAKLALEGPRGRRVLVRAEGDRWLLTEPISARADTTAADRLVREALNVRVKEFISDAPEDLAAFGLADPQLTVTLWQKAEAASEDAPDAGATDDVEEAENAPGEAEKAETAGESAAPEPPAFEVARVLQFGTWADLKRETVYCTPDGGKHVVSVVADKLKDLDLGVAALRDKHALAYDKARVTAVEVRHEDASFRLEKTDGTWHVTPPDGEAQKAEKAAVDALLDELKGLAVLYYLQEDDPRPTFPPGARGVRLRVEGEAGQRGFDLVQGQEATVITNIREDWVGRVNENDLDNFGRDWLAYLDRDVLAVKPEKAVKLAVKTPERQIRLERADADSPWRMVEPIEAEPDQDAVDDILREMLFLKAERYVAADPGRALDQVVITATETAEEGKTVERTVRLAVQEDGTILGRANGGPMVFEMAPDPLYRLVGEVLPQDLVSDLKADDVTSIAVEAGGKTLKLEKQGDAWVRLGSDGKPVDTVDAEAAEAIAEAVAKAKVVRWAAYEAENAGTYGLDAPAVGVTVTTADRAVTVLVSGAEVDEKVATLVENRPLRYVSAKGDGRVGLLTGSTLRTLLDAKTSLEAKAEVTTGG